MIDGFSCGHVYYACAGLLKVQGDAFPVLVDRIVVYASAFVVVQFFMTGVERSVRRKYLAPYVYVVPDITFDIVSRVHREARRSISDIYPACGGSGGTVCSRAGYETCALVVSRYLPVGTYVGNGGVAAFPAYFPEGRSVRNDCRFKLVFLSSVCHLESVGGQDDLLRISANAAFVHTPSAS